MIRKQLYLTPEIDRELALTAGREGRTVAEVVREILAKELKTKRRSGNCGKVLLGMARKAVDGPKDLSRDLSSYLYGRKSLNYGKNEKTSR